MVCALPVAAQDDGGWKKEQGYGVQSRLVQVPAIVTDAQGRSIRDLQATDFILLDNGRPQKALVDSFDTGLAPISLVIAVQAAGVSAAALEKIVQIGAMIQPLVTGERGRVALVVFDDEVRLSQDWTNDPAEISNAFYRLRPGEPRSARMLDAVVQGIDMLRARTVSRRVLLLISESKDRGSQAELDSVMTAAQAVGVQVFAITYSPFKTAFTTQSYPKTRLPEAQQRQSTLGREEPGSPPRNAGTPPPPEQRVDLLGGLDELRRLGMVNTAETLTKGTGGTVFSFARLKGLEESIQKLSGELHSQYVLSFVPEAAKPGYHQLELRVKRPGQYQIRARPGYWAQEMGR